MNEPAPEIEVVVLGPNDVLVVSLPEGMSKEAAEVVRAPIKEIFPDHQILAIPRSVKLGVVRREGGGA